jgi:hypothetical protein
MSRLDTRSQQSFARPGKVTYSFTPNSPKVTITLPPASTWTSGLHWHETHTEYLQITSGSALVTIEKSTKLYGANDGPIRVDQFVNHEWKRAEDQDVDKNLVVEEWTDPSDGQKEVFFRNLSSVLQQNPDASGHWVVLQLFIIFGAMDNYPVMVEGVSGRLVTHFVLGLATIVGFLLGLRATYPEYTPKVGPKAEKDS